MLSKNVTTNTREQKKLVASQTNPIQIICLLRGCVVIQIPIDTRAAKTGLPNPQTNPITDNPTARLYSSPVGARSSRGNRGVVPTPFMVVCMSFLCRLCALFCTVFAQFIRKYTRLDPIFSPISRFAPPNLTTFFFFCDLRDTISAANPKNGSTQYHEVTE